MYDLGLKSFEEPPKPGSQAEQGNQGSKEPGRSSMALYYEEGIVLKVAYPR